MTVTRIERKTRPSNGDLQDQIQEVHDCLHAQAAEVRQDRAESQQRDTVLTGSMEAMGREMTAMGARMALVEAASTSHVTAMNAVAGRIGATDARVELLIKFFRVPQPTSNGKAPRRRLSMANIEWWQAVIAIIASILGSLSAWKYLDPAIAAFRHALLTR